MVIFAILTFSLYQVAHIHSMSALYYARDAYLTYRANETDPSSDLTVEEQITA